MQMTTFKLHLYLGKRTKLQDGKKPSHHLRNTSHKFLRFTVKLQAHKRKRYFFSCHKAVVSKGDVKHRHAKSHLIESRTYIKLKVKWV